MSNNAVRAIWVVGKFEGDQAKKVTILADAGSGYFLLERPDTKYNPTCLAAFRIVLDGPLPAHLTEVRDPLKIKEYERMRKERQGIHDSRDISQPSEEVLQKLRAVFDRQTAGEA